MYETESGRIKCRCNGEVENCSRCAGIGTYIPYSPEQVTRSGKRQSSLGGLDPLAYRAVCDRCSFRGSPEEMREHRLTKHSGSENLIRFIARTKKSKPSKKSKRQQSRSGGHAGNTREDSHRQCEGKKLRAELIAAGIIIPSEVKKGKRTKVQKLSGKRSNGERVSVKTTSRGYRTFEGEDLKDATRGMGFFSRENGRIGSHPLHDRFDDEGHP